MRTLHPLQPNHENEADTVETWLRVHVSNPGKPVNHAHGFLLRNKIPTGTCKTKSVVWWWWWGETFWEESPRSISKCFSVVTGIPNVGLTVMGVRKAVSQLHAAPNLVFSLTRVVHLRFQNER
jgi:hypothetical protein